MQYLLSEKEYNELRDNNQVYKLKQDKILQDLCTKVADYMPIKWTWGKGKKNPEPWGCIHTQEIEWFCDECPVEKVCPSNKHFSK